jgi:hypothetical protein
MLKLTDHYQQLFGFPAVRKVDDVKLSVSGLKIEVYHKFNGNDVVCRQCGVDTSIINASASSGKVAALRRPQLTAERTIISRSGSTI